MKRFSTFLGPLLLAATLATTLYTGDAHGWEAATTHAGLTEQSALTSDLHKRLQQQFGTSQGLYSMLTMPTKDAPSLFEIVARLNPTHGYVPDASGTMSALSWLVLGSVVADVPAEHAGNHFLDPRTGKGLTGATNPGVGKRAHLAALRAGRGPSLSAGGTSASTWWQSAENPLGYAGFAKQFRKAVSASSSVERERHLAGSLLSAGAMLHILQDMGAPSRVRDDIHAHQTQIGSAETDRGSRFERIAALAFGRLGIPKAVSAPRQTSLANHFSNPEGTGLADRISQSYFSAGTLPSSFKVTRNTGSTAFRTRLLANIKRPAPAGSSETSTTRFDLVAARNAAGATWRTDAGVCLAEYRLRNAKVHWGISDDCALEQLEAILPEVAGYGISFLHQLFPNDITIGTSKKDGGTFVRLGDGSYGSGALRAFAEGADGRRAEFFKASVERGSTATLSRPPNGTVRITVLFDGNDTAGKPRLATASVAWPLS